MWCVACRVVTHGQCCNSDVMMAVKFGPSTTFVLQQSCDCVGVPIVASHAIFLVMSLIVCLRWMIASVVVAGECCLQFVFHMAHLFHSVLLISLSRCVLCCTHCGMCWIVCYLNWFHRDLWSMMSFAADAMICEPNRWIYVASCEHSWYNVQLLQFVSRNRSCSAVCVCAWYCVVVDCG